MGEKSVAVFNTFRVKKTSKKFGDFGLTAAHYAGWLATISIHHVGSQILAHLHLQCPVRSVVIVFSELNIDSPRYMSLTTSMPASRIGDIAAMLAATCSIGASDEQISSLKT